MSRAGVRPRPRAVRIAALFALLVAGALGSGRVVHAQWRRGQIFLSVVDGAGATVRALEASDVQVFEDDAECKTVKVEPVEWPMKLTVLVDNGPKSADYLVSLREGLREFFFEVPDGVEVSLLTIAPQPRWIVRPTSDRQELVKGIGLVAPDRSGGQFFDALAEAGARIEKDKSDHFPVIMMITSDVGSGTRTVKDNEFERLQKQIVNRGVTVHVVMITSTETFSFSDVRGRIQMSVGMALTKLSGGRYESIVAPSKLPTLLAGYSKQIAASDRRQKPQFRVTYEPADRRAPTRVFANVLVSGYTGILTIDGHIPDAR